MSLKEYSDQHGLKYTASSQESAEGFDQLVSSYMGFRPTTGEILKGLMELDPKMPMALCAKGYFAKLIGSANHSKRAVGIASDLGKLVDEVKANERERKHAQALSSWCAGDLETTTRIWEDILLDYPNDGMALRLAHFTHFYSGDGRMMRDSIARILPLWSTDHPNYGFLLGMYAFGLEESGDYVQAEKYGRMAVERNPCDAWSVHAIAHVMEMTERHEQGIEWVDGLEKDWSTVNNFRFHLYWHKCLYLLERGEFDSVLNLYDEQIVSDIDSDFYLDICNASSLLWRLEMFGIEVGSRWQKLAEVSARHTEDKDLIFVSLHYLMALIANESVDAREQMMENIRSWSLEDSTQGKISADVGVLLAEGLKLARARDYEQAYRKIELIRYSMDQIGGSKAQRDVFTMIMLDCLKSSHETIKARSFFAERVAMKKQSSWSWKNYGDLLKQTGEINDAKYAFDKVNSIQTF